MRLWMVRHGQTLAPQGRCYGRTDVGVEAGATEALARLHIADLPRGVRMVSSPLQRCSLLAQAIARGRPDLVLACDPRIAEMDFGAWEQGDWTAIARVEFDAWTRDFADHRAGGDGESTRAFMQRVGQAFDDWRARGEDAIWITHAGVIRAVSLWRQGIRVVERADQWPAAPIAFGERVVFEVL